MNQRRELLKLKKYLLTAGLITGTTLLSSCGNNDTNSTIIIQDNDNYILYDYNRYYINTDGSGYITIYENNGEKVLLSTSKIVISYNTDEFGNSHDKALKYLNTINKDNKYNVYDYDENIQLRRNK